MMRLSSLLRKLAMLVLPALLLVACAKEEPVAPCGHEAAGSTLRAVTMQSEGGMQATTPGRVPGPGERDGIGDDGDDLSGAEKPRKQRPN